MSETTRSTRPQQAGPGPAGLSSLEGPSPIEAARLLERLGFLVQTDLPDRAGPAWLAVALRDEPALSHFDPEVVELWTSSDGRGRRATVNQATPLPLDAAFAWGAIRIVDRMHVANEYLAFGGRLVAERVGPGETIVVLTSPVPILREGGHSQGFDLAAEHAGAFFARIRLAVDYVAGLEARLAAASPIEIYAAFVTQLAGRFRTRAALRDTQPGLWSIVRAEEARLARLDAAAVAAGTLILDLMRGA